MNPKQKLVEILRNLDAEGFRYLRQSQHLTTTDIGNLLGKSKRTIERWESGTSPIADFSRFDLGDYFESEILRDPYFDKYLKSK